MLNTTSSPHFFTFTNLEKSIGVCDSALQASDTLPQYFYGKRLMCILVNEFPKTLFTWFASPHHKGLQELLDSLGMSFHMSIHLTFQSQEQILALTWGLVLILGLV
mmetsp:Transcript_13797/g.23013  ORF Transcript_13797/g.23013 Transcript_13797/m.23013 type:complete len:106 (-) Transcript_13797:126-443(-)